MPASTDFLFTYGTLMKGFPNPFAERLHDLSTFIGQGSFPGSLYLVSWYPGAIYQEHSSGRVQGEVYRITGQDLLLRELDEYEDISEDEEKSLYLRKVIPIRMQDGPVLPCWAYLYNQDVSRLSKIEGGDFRNRIL